MLKYFLPCGIYENLPFHYEFLIIAFLLLAISFFWKNKYARYLPLVFLYPIIYFSLMHIGNIFLYGVSAVDPYYYYAYSPGFWAVDFSFWILTTIFYILFRRNGAGRILSLLFAFCLDASAVGIFLLMFESAYHIIFRNIYYVSMFYFALMWFVPIHFMNFKRIHIFIPIGIVLLTVIWSFFEGNIGYFLTVGVILDMLGIVYCFIMWIPMLYTANRTTTGQPKSVSREVGDEDYE
ncbi:MAG: hypothetical protein ACYDAP_07010 [Thermoplasmataceae archaeon]